MRKLVDNEGTPYKPSITAIAGLAWLASGDKKYEFDINESRTFLEEFIEKVRMGGKKEQSNWPLALAGLFYAELYLRGDKKAKPVLEKIAKLLLNSQNANGAWGHQKENMQKNMFKAQGMVYPDTLTVATNFCAAALGIMKHRCGVKVPEDALTRAFKFYEKSQQKDGTFPYDIANLSAGEAGRTSGGVFALWCMKREGENVYKDAYKFVAKNLSALPESHASSCMHVLTGALTAFVNGEFEKWKALFNEKIIAKQDKDGHFGCICSGNVTVCDERGNRMGSQLLVDISRAYVTACYALGIFVQSGTLKILVR